MNRKYSHGGISLSGLIYTSIIFGTVAITVMKLFPLYNEKTKVDFSLEKVLYLHISVPLGTKVKAR